MAQSYNLGERTILVADFDVDALQAVTPVRYSYTPVPRFPAALRDIAVVVEESLTAERLEAEIRAAGGDLLREVRLFDLYRGNQIPAGTKSLAYALSYQADDRTLADKDIDKAQRVRLPVRGTLGIENAEQGAQQIFRRNVGANPACRDRPLEKQADRFGQPFEGIGFQFR